MPGSQQQRAARRAPTDLEPRGASRSFCSSTCVNCHAIRGTGRHGAVGPDLTHLGEPRHARRGRASTTRREPARAGSRDAPGDQAGRADARLHRALSDDDLGALAALPRGAEVSVATSLAAAVPRVQSPRRARAPELAAAAGSPPSTTRTSGSSTCSPASVFFVLGGLEALLMRDPARRAAQRPSSSPAPTTRSSPCTARP